MITMIIFQALILDLNCYSDFDIDTPSYVEMTLSNVHNPPTINQRTNQPC